MISIDGFAEMERIGRGGLGDVYRAIRTSTGGAVAIKVLRDVSDESVAWHRTRRELTALVSLAGHANVIQLLEVLELTEGPALVMEYASGGSIADLLLRRDRPLSVGETVLVGRQTATALTAAHARDIVHRDVKPQNLLIDAYGQVKLCDFGIAAMARSDEFRARTSAISMRYASPEDLDDDDVGPASDVYSLGATMLHLSRGAPPTLKERLAPWIPPTTDDAALAALDAIVAACLHPSPGERPSAAAIADELERLSWSIDERNRALASESLDGDDAHDDARDAAPTDLRAAGPAMFVAPDVDDAPTVVRPAVSKGDDEPERDRAVDRHLDDQEPDDGDLDDRDPDDRDPDDTVHRPARQLSRPRPMRRRRRLVVAGSIVVVALVIVVMWPDDGVADVEFVGRPAGLVDVRELDWPTGAVGECLVQHDEALDVVGCGRPHDLQRVGVGTLDVPADEPFDGAEVQAAVRAACDTAFSSFVGVPPAESDFDAPFTAPSAETWEQGGDRRYECLLGVAGQRIVGDAEGAAR